jgi:hypothetical protein
MKFSPWHYLALVLWLFLIAYVLSVAVALPCDRMNGQPYNRDDWPHWVDNDKNGCNTRDDTLKEESLLPVRVGEDGCRVISGLWYGVYTGKVFVDPRKLDLDHVVSLSEAHALGGWRWPAWRKMAYANYRADPYHLILVEAAANRQKGDRGVHQWMPPLAKTHVEIGCAYVLIRRSIRARWDLNEVSKKEQAAERQWLDKCQQKQRK